MNPNTVFVSLLATALVVSAVGFFRLVWFISVGYGYAVAAMAVVLAYLAAATGVTWLLASQLALLLLYGIRLGTYVLMRDNQVAYRQAARAAHGEITGGPGKKFAIWIAVSLLYVLMFSPAAFHSLRAGTVPMLAVVGLLLMAGGLIVEGLSDWQKSAAKKIAPERFCDRGLFAWMRCPAYLGEITFWIGNWMIGVPFYVQWWHWTVSLAGLVCIILIMLGSTKRLEASQQRRYGQMPEFQQYVKTVPILIPWIHIYSLQGLRWTLG